MPVRHRHGLGWIPDVPDLRDFTPDSAPVQEVFAGLPSDSRKIPLLPPRVDLRVIPDSDTAMFSPPPDQQSLRTASVFAVLGMIEYFERLAFGRCFSGSALFLYQTTVQQTGRTGDPGAGLRDVLKTLVRLGTPTEELWPYVESQLPELSTSLHLLASAKDFWSCRYLRLDRRNDQGDETLLNVRRFLAAGFPVAFGFPLRRQAGCRL